MSQYIKSAWWESQDTAAAKTLFGLVETLVQQQQGHAAAYMRYAGLYGDQEVWSLLRMTMSATAWDLQFRRLNFNVTRNMIDTVVSKHAVAQPRIEILTEGGSWEQQQRAKNTTRFVAGEFERTKLYREAPLALRDALIFGDGYIKWYVQDKKICCERAFPGEIYVDDAESINGTPRQLFQVRYVAREVLRAVYSSDPEKLQLVNDASGTDLILDTGQTRADMLKVIEGWHLPSSEDAGDGCHIIALSSGTLLNEPWEYACFPFVRVRWNPAMRGWYSQGLADQLMGIQVEINRVAKRIGLGIHLMGVPYYLVDAGSKIVKEHLTSEVGHIVTYLGTKPEARTNQVFTPEVYQYLENLYNKAYALAGISPLEASAKKPAGLDSEPSLREYADLASERHAFFSMEWQEFFKDCAFQVLRCAAELKANGVDVEAQNAGKGFLDVVKFSNCLMDDDNFTFKVGVGNLLPTTIAGKINRVQDMANSGILTPDLALKLLDFPDLQAAVGNLTAQTQYLDKILHEMLVEGKAVEVEAPFLSLSTAVPYVTNAYLQAVTDGAPENRLQLVRDWLAAAQAAVPPPPPQAVTPGPPQAAPQAPPM